MTVPFSVDVPHATDRGGCDGLGIRPSRYRQGSPPVTGSLGRNTSTGLMQNVYCLVEIRSTTPWQRWLRRPALQALTRPSRAIQLAEKVQHQTDGHLLFF